jgi:conjugal transfer pilus assembly protein TrbC
LSDKAGNMTGKLILIAAFICAGGTAYGAGTPRMPTDEQIRAAAGRAEPIPSEAQMREMMQKKMDEAQRAIQGVKPGDMAAASKSFPDVKVPAGGVDLEQMAKRFEDLGKPTGQPTAGNVYVFVSLSMPRVSLERVVRDSERAGSVIVVRGLKDGSLRATVKVMRELMGEHKAAFQIDPKKFERYKVSYVPTTVLIVGDMSDTEPGCQTPTPKYYSVEGDVSLEYALDEIERQRPDARVKAETYLVRLRGEL